MGQGRMNESKKYLVGKIDITFHTLGMGNKGERFAMNDTHITGMSNLTGGLQSTVIDATKLETVQFCYAEFQMNVNNCFKTF